MSEQNLTLEEKREILIDYYERQNRLLTQDDYKRHYRQMTQLLREGRTVADGKTIRLTNSMLENLFWSYELSELMRKDRAALGGSKSKGGGRPAKNPSEWSESYRKKMESKQRQTERKANEEDR